MKLGFKMCNASFYVIAHLYLTVFIIFIAIVAKKLASVVQIKCRNIRFRKWSKYYSLWMGVPWDWEFIRKLNTHTIISILIFLKRESHFRYRLLLKVQKCRTFRGCLFEKNWKTEKLFPARLTEALGLPRSRLTREFHQKLKVCLYYEKDRALG